MNISKLWNAVAVCIAVGVTGFSASAASVPVQSVHRNADGVTLKMYPGEMQLRIFSPDIIQVVYGTNTKLPEIKSLAVVSKPEHAKWKLDEKAGEILLSTDEIQARVDQATGAVSFFDRKGALLLSENPAGGKSITPNRVAGNETTGTSAEFVLSPGEGIYGLGQHQQGAWNYGSGAIVTLAQRNTEVGIPVITSSKGYVLLWDNPAVATISTGVAGEPGASQKMLRWSSESGKAVDYYFCYGGGTIDTALKAYRHLTGDAPLMPKWELGFWQCKERYASQEELLGIARQLRELKVPVDGIIQDWQYWPPGTNTWGSHQFDPARYPDPTAMFKELHDEHYHTLISVWAKFDLGSDNSKELNAAGGMFPQVTRYVSPPGQGQWYDPFAPQGRETYWKQMRDQLFARGVDGWWLDAPEPEINGMGFRNYTTPLGPGYEVYNAYPLMHSTGIYQGQRATTESKRVIILTRSAYAGQQRNSAITWSGDIQGTWQVLKNQIPAGLNFSLSGIPYWNTDTGGFFGNRSAGNGDPTNPQYQELFSRWFQFSAFCPMFRVHGSYGLRPGKELYRFDVETQEIMRTYLDLRYRLLPYLYSVAWQVTSGGTTFMRPLVMDFPKDNEALNIGDQYLFGPAIMVTPVTAAGATTRSVYLPAARAPWFNFWTGENSPAGQRVEAAAPVETMPLFIRPGSIIPLGPFLQYSSEKPADPVELRIYRGANGEFLLYEDEGDGYNYEKGVHATIPFEWNEARRTLTIGKRSGSFPGMLKQRIFNIVWVSANHGAGSSSTEKPDATIHYSGEVVRIAGPAMP